jgi:membrane-associated phospholipid phosphatase
VAQARAILCGIGHVIRRSWIAALVFSGLAGVATITTVPHDRELLSALRALSLFQSDGAHNFAHFLGIWGDYPTYNLPLALGLWVYGAWSRKRLFRRLAVICFLGATAAGLLDDCFRWTLGRPRPDAGLPDGFYGFPASLRSEFQSFPSGHAAAVFGTALSLLVIDLPMGAFTTIFAFLVIWARMENFRHFPSDILAGSCLGILVGLWVGLGAKAHWRTLPDSPATRFGPLRPAQDEVRELEPLNP